MFNYVERRRTWFTISAIAILPGILFMIYSLATNGTILPFFTTRYGVVKNPYLSRSA